MNDDSSLPELDPGVTAASAHFDGVADADERALVDGSDELRAMVASFATAKAALNDLPTVADADIDDMVAVALAEFDTLAASLSAATSSASHAAARTLRPRWSRVLTIAAAAVIIGVVGVAIANGVGGNSSSTSSAGKTIFAATTIAAASATSGALQPSAAASVAGGATSTIGAINGSADALPRYDQTIDLRTLPGSVDVAGATADSGLPSVPAPQGGTPGSNGIPLTGPVLFPFTCSLTPQQVFIAEINWKGAPAAAVRDTVTGITQAIDPQCNVLVSVEP
jgi:hypothetical protein